jgi:hypothetical protein
MFDVVVDTDVIDQLASRLDVRSTDLTISNRRTSTPATMATSSSRVPGASRRGVICRPGSALEGTGVLIGRGRTATVMSAAIPNFTDHH